MKISKTEYGLFGLNNWSINGMILSLIKTLIKLILLFQNILLKKFSACTTSSSSWFSSEPWTSTSCIGYIHLWRIEEVPPWTALKCSFTMVAIQISQVLREIISIIVVIVNYGNFLINTKTNTIGASRLCRTCLFFKDLFRFFLWPIGIILITDYNSFIIISNLLIGITCWIISLSIRVIK